MESMLRILTEADLYVPADQREAFASLRETVLRDYPPANQLQAEAVNSLLRALWEIHRCNLAEKQLGAEIGIDPLLAEDKRLARIQRTRAKAEREIQAARQDYLRLQTAAALRAPGKPFLASTSNVQTFLVNARKATRNPKKDKPPTIH
jgi:hypothetical protein